MNFSDTFLYQKLTYSACSLDHYLFNLNAFRGSMQKGNTCKTFAHSWLLGHFMSFYRHFRVYSIGGIHKPCGQERGRGGSRKNHVCPHRGEGGLEACPRGQKLFSATSFLCMNSKKAARISKKMYL